MILICLQKWALLQVLCPSVLPPSVLVLVLHRVGFSSLFTQVCSHMAVPSLCGGADSWLGQSLWDGAEISPAAWWTPIAPALAPAHCSVPLHSPTALAFVITAKKVDAPNLMMIRQKPALTLAIYFVLLPRQLNFKQIHFSQCWPCYLTVRRNIDTNKTILRT